MPSLHWIRSLVPLDCSSSAQTVERERDELRYKCSRLTEELAESRRAGDELMKRSDELLGDCEQKAVHITQLKCDCALSFNALLQLFCNLFQSLREMTLSYVYNIVLVKLNEYTVLFSIIFCYRHRKS